MNQPAQSLLGPVHRAASPTSTTSPTSLSYAERNENHWKRNLAVCVFGSFTTLVSLSMLLPFLPLYVRQLGVESTSSVIQWSGIAFGATFLGTALGASRRPLRPQADAGASRSRHGCSDVADRRRAFGP
jgi:MFS family permease